MKRILLILPVFFLLPFSVFANFERNLYFGIVNDPDVTRLQEFLNNEGVYSGPVTGNFLMLTREGVKNFQQRERIEPVLGYFGPLTRSRANEILSGSVAEQIASLQAKIAELTARLKDLQARLIQEEQMKEAPAPDTTPPAFTVAPHVKSKGFISDSSLGVRYPYRIVFDWSVDETGLVEEPLTCSPVIKAGKITGRSTEYFPEPNTDYACSVTVKDQAGNAAAGEVSFSSPAWVSAAELWTAPSFSATEENPFKIGEFAVYNGTTTSVLFANVEMIITDDMDSADNRDREVTFLLRDGKTAIDTLIGKKKFTFSINHPATIGVPHKTFLAIPFDILLAKGEEKLASLWVEQFKYVRSGTLKIKSDKIEAVGPAVEGGFDFVLTKEPPL